jgi:competence protein ComEC
VNRRRAHPRSWGVGRTLAIAPVAVWFGAELGLRGHRWSLLADVAHGGRPIAVVLGFGACVAAAGLRRLPLLAIVLAGLVAVGFGARSAAAFDGPFRPGGSGSVDGWVELIGDPVPLEFGVRVDVRIAGHHVEARASEAAAQALTNRMAGEWVELVGRLRDRPAAASWLDTRHVVARLDIESVGEWRRGSAASIVANGFRRALRTGARPLGSARVPLFAGFVIGDDRGQSDRMADDFRAAGLGHLLAVSGQNVAFLLAALTPVTRRCRSGVRVAVIVAALAFFVVAARPEPSVLRAVTMAAIVAVGAAVGRPVGARRSLGASVAFLVLVDPQLVHSVGFQLSVLATIGLLEISPRIAPHLPGPAWLTEALATTSGAQLAVAPLAVLVFGSEPVAALPANLMAGAAAGPVMVWGLVAGPVAGVFGGRVAWLLHLPTSFLLGWIELVARTAARVPLGELRAPHLLLLGLAVALVVGSARRGVSRHDVSIELGVPLGRGPGRDADLGHDAGPGHDSEPERSPARPSARIAVLAVAMVSVALVSPLVGVSRLPVGGTAVASGVELWRGSAGGVVVVLRGAAHEDDALQALRRAGVRRIDLVVATSTARGVTDAARSLAARYGIAALWAPTRHRVIGARTPAPGTTVTIGGVAIGVGEVTDTRLGVALDTS